MKKILKIIIFSLILGLGYSLGVAVFENIEYNNKINDFKNRGTLVKTITYDNYNYNYYEVSRLYDYEFDNKESIRNESPNNLIIGNKGDILLTPESPFPYVWGVHHFVSYFFGGHSVLISDNNNNIIQSTGIHSSKGITPGVIMDTIFHDGNIKEDDVVVEEVSNYFFKPNHRVESDDSYDYYNKFYRNKIVGIRVKDISDEEIDEVIDIASDLVDNALYNYMFFLDYYNKYYCTDLISRTYSNAVNSNNKKININDDGFITSINDIVLSEDSYIFFYWEVVKENNINMYYLSN